MLEQKTYIQLTFIFQLKKECCNMVIQKGRQTRRNFFYLWNTLRNLFCKRSTHFIPFFIGSYDCEFTLPEENLELHRVLRGETGERASSLKQGSWSSERKGLQCQADLNYGPSLTHQLWTSTINSPHNQEEGTQIPPKAVVPNLNNPMKLVLFSMFPTEKTKSNGLTCKQHNCEAAQLRP